MTNDVLLRAELDRIGAKIASSLQRARIREAAAARLRATAPWLVIAPAVAVVIASFGRLVDPRIGVDLLWIAVFAIAPTLVLTLLAVFEVALRLTHGSEGLARLDHDLRLEGRLRAAHDFLSRAETSSFQRAAIEDAVPHLARAAAYEVPTTRVEWPIGRLLSCSALAVVLGVLAAFLAPTEGGSAETVGARRDPFVAASPTAQRRDAPARERGPTDSKKPEPERTKSPGAETKTSAAKAAPSLDSKARESEGKTGEGISANATPTNAASNSRGFTSSQTPPSDKTEKTEGKPKKVKPKKPEKEVPTVKKKLDSSGATAGKGTGAGSSKNPGSTEWESKDQTTSDEEDPLTEDEEVNDEDDESEARGGLQPSLRDRRPATNRDLLIGFGNQPNPDANGRGGPSEQKKSRGVASLVLGVPIPDHVKGQPNPGRTKITQERVLPEPDTVAPLAAESRPPRSSPVAARDEGALPAEPWLHTLVKNYFLAARAVGAASESSASKAKGP